MVDINSLVETVKGQTGIDDDKAKNLLGSFFSFAKSNGVPVPEEAQRFVDDAEAKNQTAKESGEHGGFMDSAVGFLGTLNSDASASRDAPATTDGGSVDSVPELFGLAKQFGIDPTQVMSALPTVVKTLKDQGVDVSSIAGKIPGMPSGGEGGNDKTEEMVSDVMKKASGFLGGFGK